MSVKKKRISSIGEATKELVSKDESNKCYPLSILDNTREITRDEFIMQICKLLIPGRKKVVGQLTSLLDRFNAKDGGIDDFLGSVDTAELFRGQIDEVKTLLGSFDFNYNILAGTLFNDSYDFRYFMVKGEKIEVPFKITKKKYDIYLISKKISESRPMHYI